MIPASGPYVNLALGIVAMVVAFVVLLLNTAIVAATSYHMGIWSVDAMDSPTKHRYTMFVKFGDLVLAMVVGPLAAYSIGSLIITLLP